MDYISRNNFCREKYPEIKLINLDSIAEKTIYTGLIDVYFDYCLGNLEYRFVQFETEVLDKSYFHGNIAVNYTDSRSHEPGLSSISGFMFGKDENGNNLPKMVISSEYSSE